MEQHLGLSPAWLADVMTPAFATNFRVLYERRDAAALGDPGLATG